MQKLKCVHRNARAAWSVFFLSGLLVLMGGCVHMGTQSVSEINFRGIPWGSSLQDHEDLKPIKNEAHFQVAVREGETLSFGEAMLNEIRYIFINSAFVRAEMDYGDYQNLFFIREELEKRFGPPDNNREESHIYQWFQGDLSILLRYYRLSENKNGTLTFSYNPGNS